MHYLIHDFMYEDLNLKGVDLNVFALIYSFREYNGSLDTIRKCVGAKSITTIQYSLKRLVEEGLIIKNKIKGKYSYSIYHVNFSHSKIPPRVSGGYSRGEWTGGIDYETVIDEDFPEEEIETDIQIGWRKTV